MKVKYFNSNVPEDHWEIWPLEGEKIIVLADHAEYDKGRLYLAHSKYGPTGEFIKFRSAVKYAHGGFGYSHYWVGDGKTVHIVEAQANSFMDNGEYVFWQEGSLVAVFQNAEWVLSRGHRLFKHDDKARPSIVSISQQKVILRRKKQ